MNGLYIALSLLLVSFAYGAPDASNSTKPPVQLYKVQDKVTKHYCILIQAGIRLHFNYSIHGTSKNATLELDVPKNANKTAYGTCGNNTQTLSINVADDAVLTLAFNKTGKSHKSVALVAMRFKFDSSLLNGSAVSENYTAALKNLTQFEYTCGKGFLCMSNVTLTFNNTTPLVQLDTVNLRLEAFRNSNTTTFNADYTQCPADSKISNIIPIAVGAALGALVLIVLIAYLVGRKRSQRGGYETV